MCFHHKQTKDAVTLSKRFKATIKDPSVFEPAEAYNGFTHPFTPVITDEDFHEIKHLRWGLVPFWARSLDIKWNTLNAKIETVRTAKSYKSSAQKRCWVLVDGFFEWQWLDPKGKQKQKYLIYRPGEEVFAMGGIYSYWTDRQTGAPIGTYSIVTTEANKLMAEIHNNKKRMPVILTPENEEAWLAGEDFEAFKSCDPELEARKI